MTSRSQVASNRRNACLSTGPTTQAGKRAVASNARRHGLSGRLVEGSDAFHQAEQLARSLLANLVHTGEAEAAARTYAQSQVKLDLIRQSRRILLDAMLRASPAATHNNADHSGASDQDPVDLAKLGRYERMARAERQRALEVLEKFGLSPAKRNILY